MTAPKPPACAFCTWPDGPGEWVRRTTRPRSSAPVGKETVTYLCELCQGSPAALHFADTGDRGTGGLAGEMLRGLNVVLAAVRDVAAPDPHTQVLTMLLENLGRPATDAEWPVLLRRTDRILDRFTPKVTVGDFTALQALNQLAQGTPRTCRVCGCTDNDCSQCIRMTGAPCCWALPDVCSRCAPSVIGVITDPPT